MKISLQKSFYLSLALFSIFSLFGCAGGVLNVLVQPASFETGNKINLKAMLYLNEEFRNAKWEDKPIGWEPNVIHLGDNFAINAENLTKTIFLDVTVISSENEITKTKGDVILAPKVISAKQNRPLWTWHDSTLTVAVEWTLKDLENNVLWITTIKGEGIAKLMKDEERVKSLVDDLFGKSYKAIISSPEIRDYEKGFMEK